jgi:aspartate-semialdehyde dehydrogenase
MTLNIAVLGATGTVGREILSVLDEKGFPADRIVALASRKSMGKEVSLGESRTLKALDVETFDFSSVSLCILAAGERAARKWAPKIAGTGCIVVDVSPAFRMDPDVPLIAPEANAEAISGWTRRRIVSVPGGAAAILAPILKPLHAIAGVARVSAATYHSVSELGRRAMDELWTQTKGIYVNQAPESREFPRQIAFNVIPQVGDFLDDGYTDEEQRLREELQKVLDPSIRVVATCVQTPVFIGHAIAAHIELKSPLSATDARARLRESPGLMVIDRREEEGYVTPVECVGDWATYVSRIRDDPSVPHGLALWATGDNLRKAAALNAVQVAEMLLRSGALPAPGGALPA